MKSAGYMTATSLVLLAVAVAVAPQIGTEVLLGMIAPLLIAVTTLLLVERTSQENPEKLTAFMVKAFGAKIVLFGGYVTALISLTPIDPVPFMVSFTAYFIGLHMTEAWLLRSIFTEASR